MKRLLLLSSILIPMVSWADINVTQGSGKTVRTDTVNGGEYQMIKIIDGTTGGTSSATVSSIGLKVDLSTTQVVNSTSTIQNIQQALPAGSNSLGVMNVVSTNSITTNFNNIAQPVLITSGTLNVISTSTSHVDFNGIAQPVLVATGTALVAITSTPTIQVIISTTGAIQVGAWNVSLLSTPTVTVLLSTSGAVEVGPWQVSVLSTPTFQTILSTNGAVEVGTWSTSNSTNADVGMFSDNGVSSTTNRLGTLPGVYQNSSSAQTARSQGRDGALSIGTDGLLWSANLPSITGYSYVGSTNSFTVANSTNDVADLCGNSRDTVELMSIRVSCTQTTAGIIQLGIVKRSTAYNGAWSTMTVVPESSNYTATNSTAAFFTTANEVAGTLVGYLDSYKLGCMATGTATPNDIYISPADWRIKPIVLNSASECVGVNMNGATISGGAMSVTFDWIEKFPNNFNP